jgi:hypothetical protein
MNVVLFQITVHTEEDFEHFSEKDRRRRKADIKMHDPALEGCPLRIPKPYWEYNQYMGSVDQFAQLEAFYTTYHTLWRSWWPLFFPIINASVTNAWKVFEATGRPSNHKWFQMAISKELREEGLRELQYAHILGTPGGLQRMRYPNRYPYCVPEGTVHRRIQLET